MGKVYNTTTLMTTARHNGHISIKEAHISLWSHFSDQHFRFQVLTVTASSCHTCMNVCLQLPKYSPLLLIKELIKHIFAMSVQARWIRMGTAYTDDASEENQKKLTVHRFNFYTHNINIFTSDMHVSHFCHNKLCIRLHRLSLDL